VQNQGLSGFAREVIALEQLGQTAGRLRVNVASHARQFEVIKTTKDEALDSGFG